jgi:hypothetical protein
MGDSGTTNRLAGETSPYLLQHAHNPVDWYPWGPEALERSRREDKPILLSIGYAACHWCHVMERESFENEAVAALMNESFICIKVDREERPDLDEIYMTATVALSGSGGWPMTVFLAPDQRPFFAGTYFPPTDKYGRPGFTTLLRSIAELWRSDRPRLLAQAAELTQHIQSQARPTRPTSVAGDAVAAAAKQLARAFDPRFGGFGQAPKFPPSAALSLLLRHYRRTGDAEALRIVTATLDGMKNGGMYDQLAGGFARYSTDERWLVPHFEKMLYDNAQLARVYLEAFQVTGAAEYRRIAVETLDYVAREMQSAEGGYYSATDADSEGVEGKYFVWAFDEVREILGAEDAERLSAYFDVTPDGNWEHTNVLNTPRAPEAVARELGISPEELLGSVERGRARLLEARGKRVPPLLDDKVLTSWNGLMIGAMAEGYRVLREPRYRDSAERAARFVLAHLRASDGGLLRTARAGKAHLAAYLEDYAYLCDALVDLYEAGSSATFLAEATTLAERMVQDFADDESGALFQTAGSHEALIVRRREGHDGALPSANAVAARVLDRLATHLERADFRERAESAIRAYGRAIEASPRSFATTLSLVDDMMEPRIEVAVVGPAADPATEALWRELGRHYLPSRVIAHREPTEGTHDLAHLPLVTGKELVAGRPAAYVCRNFACQRPASTPEELDAELRTAAGAAAAVRKSSVAVARLPGRASAEWTQRRAESFGALYAGRAYATLGATKLLVSRLGFGGYRIDGRSPEHRAALTKALREGCNLIDTSTNYTNGESERLIGETITDLVRSGELRREEVVVVSKVGYVQGPNLQIASSREAAGAAFPEMVKHGDELWHCIHPTWIEDQLTRSLERLGFETLDVLLLHNPEYFLSDRSRASEPLDSLRREFYRRLTEAFRHLEREVERGRISAYGVSSNTAVSQLDHREATELARMIAAAEAVAGANHHFRVVQLPMNLLESAAVVERNNGGGSRTVLEQALESGVAVLVNRPLNAIGERALLRLAEPPTIEAHGPELREAIDAVRVLENEFRQQLAPALRGAPGGAGPEALLAWADQLARVPAELESLEQWTEIEDHVIAPRTAHIVQLLDRVMSGTLEAPWTSFRDRYLAALDALLTRIRSRAADRSRVRLGRLTSALNPSLAEARRGEPLSRKAVWLLLSTKGVTAALVGMRTEAYVADMLPVLGWEEHAAPERAFEIARDELA